MYILGLNSYRGDSAACLVKDGQVLAAAEEERFRRIRHWTGLPTEAIQYCLKEGGIEFNDLDRIAINRQPGVNNLKRLKFIAFTSRRSALAVRLSANALGTPCSRFTP